MSPIYKCFIPNFEFKPPGILPGEQKDFLKFLAIAKLLATNAKQATREFLKNRFSQFDPIVNDNSCQIRAFHVIILASRREVYEEAQKLEKAAVAIEEAIKKLQNKPVYFSKNLSFEMLITKLNLSLDASSEMTYLLQTYFLTIGKVFQVKQDGSETAYIDYSALKDRISKQVDTELLKKIIDFTQVKLAEASVSFIQGEAEHLEGNMRMQLKNDHIEMISMLDEGSLPRPCSCAFYNFKTILLSAREKQTIIFMKKYVSRKEQSFGVFYRGCDSNSLFAPLSREEIVKLDVNTPVLVVEGLMPSAMGQEAFQQHINEVSLLNLALMNVARVFQFSNRDMNPEAYEEIGQFRRRAEELGCNLKEPRIFSIVHTHAAAIGELL